MEEFFLVEVIAQLVKGSDICCPALVDGPDVENVSMGDVSSLQVNLSH